MLPETRPGALASWSYSSRLLRLEKCRGAGRRLEPLVILECSRQLVTQPDAARLVVEAAMPMQFQIVGQIEWRQRGGHPRGDRREPRYHRVRQRGDKLRLHHDERHAQYV